MCPLIRNSECEKRRNSELGIRNKFRNHRGRLICGARPSDEAGHGGKRFFDVVDEGVNDLAGGREKGALSKYPDGALWSQGSVQKVCKPNMGGQAFDYRGGRGSGP